MPERSLIFQASRGLGWRARAFVVTLALVALLPSTGPSTPALAHETGVAPLQVS